ncbi:type II toxin-antitoxin system RelE/ParE family toxin [Sphingomonas rhizophila]|uniref:Type II toxin-antitoxin system RelE/ParE family toxin n=1 Tax=Sphingomonas rhizophila TaxID=2071607 RepID=A0A7G9S8I9_9SPHN|nr:type II toxin-antitoxin system RelE/ParE family toxin [Sphingomonas rhizophila]QNN64164.1 type II toxin-antitoxin system RelE/ParE family toxin [Sphingomonas rhizophila]
MIRTIQHRGLARFAESGDPSKLPVQNHAKVRRILQALNAATTPQDMNLPGYRFHSHQGLPKRYSVDVTGNFRIMFGWEDGDAINVDIDDPH